MKDPLCLEEWVKTLRFKGVRSLEMELLSQLWPHTLLGLGMLGWDLEAHTSLSPAGSLGRLQRLYTCTFPCSSAGLGLARSPQCGKCVSYKQLPYTP